MNLDNLICFLTAAELKSMAKASEKLHLSHPALSKQIRKLEAYYGTQLLDRNSTGVELTAAGEVLYNRLPRVLAELSDIRQELLLLTSGSPFRIGTLPSLAEHCLPDIVYAMEQDKLRIDLTVLHTSEELINMLIRRDLDAVLVDQLEDEQLKLWNKALWTEPYYAIMPIDHPLAGEQSIPLEALAEQPLIMYPPACSIRKRITSLFAERKALPSIKTEVPFGAFIPGYTAAGAGVGILPQIVAARLNHPKLKAIPLHHPSAGRVISLVAAGAAVGGRLVPYFQAASVTRDAPDATEALASQ